MFGLEVLGLVALFGTLVTHHKVINDLETERYESAFINHERHKQLTPGVPVPLGFKSQDTDFFLHLCKRYRYVRKDNLRNEDAPSVQTVYIGSKNAGFNPFAAEVIRCSGEYAIVDAGDDSCAYLLKRGKVNKKRHPENIIFYLHANFCYTKESPQQKPKVKPAKPVTKRSKSTKISAKAPRISAKPTKISAKSSIGGKARSMNAGFSKWMRGKKQATS